MLCNKMSSTIPHYTIWYNDKCYENISATRVLEFPSGKMICIFKLYYKGTYDRKITNLCFTVHEINTDKQTYREPKHQEKEKATAVNCTRTSQLYTFTMTNKL